MAHRRHFLLIGEAGNHKIQVGDHIDILEAYQRQDLPVALANRFCINGKYRNYGLLGPYTRKLTHAGSCTGEIVQLCREAQDLTIIVTSH